MTSLTQLSQAIHDAQRWHQPEQFQNPEEIQIIPLAEEALGAVVFGLDARKAQAGETIYSPHAKKPIQYRYELSNTF